MRYDLRSKKRRSSAKYQRVAESNHATGATVSTGLTDIISKLRLGQLESCSVLDVVPAERLRSCRVSSAVPPANPHTAADAPAKCAFCLCIAGRRRPRSATNQLEAKPCEATQARFSLAQLPIAARLQISLKCTPEIQRHGEQRRHTSEKLWACSKLEDVARAVQAALQAKVS